MTTEQSATAVVSVLAEPDVDEKAVEDPSEKENGAGDTGSNSDSESGDESGSVSGSDSESSSDEESDNENENENENADGISEYERLRLERIERNQAQLRQLGLLDMSLTNSNKKKKPHRKSNPAPQNLVAARRQPKREVKGKITQEQLDLRTLLLQPNRGKNKSSKNRCGNCEGCLREDDCNTCVYCELRNQGAKTRRCIFKACRNRDKKKKEKKATTTPKPEETSTEPIEHSDHCNICKSGGDLICCDACPRSYHSSCHIPKIKKVPAEDEPWFCLECDPRYRHLVALMSNKLVKVRVIEPPPQCMLCAEDCAVESESVQCKACDHHFHLACQNPPLESKPKGGAARIWKCDACKLANNPILPQYAAAAATGGGGGGPGTAKKKKVNLKLFEGEHDDDCYICSNGGELVCCDFCPKVFHPACHIPALPAIPTGIWKCCECYASERNRMTRCGECKACNATDCGKCKFCLDRPKFGGPNKLKKTCIQRECPYQSFAETFVAGRIPGEITHVNASKDKTKKRRRESSGSASASQGKKKRAKMTH